MTPPLPDTASSTTRALADALRERGELALGSDASYAERKALLESSETLTPAFATLRAEQLRKRAKRDALTFGLALLTLVFSGLSMYESAGQNLWSWLMVAFIIVAGGMQAGRWHRKHEAALLHDLLAIALGDENAESGPGAKLAPVMSPAISLDAEAGVEAAPFTRRRSHA